MTVTYNNLFSQIYDFETLHRAYMKARRGKRDRREVLKFELNLEEKIVGMAVLGDATFLYESSVESTLIEAVKNNWLINALVLDENGYSRIIKAEIENNTCKVETTK